jgi:hypothetical protein
VTLGAGNDGEATLGLHRLTCEVHPQVVGRLLLEALMVETGIGQVTHSSIFVYPPGKNEKA